MDGKGIENNIINELFFKNPLAIRFLPSSNSCYLSKSEYNK